MDDGAAPFPAFSHMPKDDSSISLVGGGAAGSTWGFGEDGPHLAW